MDFLMIQKLYENNGVPKFGQTKKRHLWYFRPIFVDFLAKISIVPQIFYFFGEISTFDKVLYSLWHIILHSDFLTDFSYKWDDNGNDLRSLYSYNIYLVTIWFSIEITKIVATKWTTLDGLLDLYYFFGNLSPRGFSVLLLYFCFLIKKTPEEYEYNDYE